MIHNSFNKKSSHKVKKIVSQLTVAPPVKRQDLYTDFENGHRIFLIADGEFHQNLAITSGEILDVIRSGGLVLGSSSMGALRASELSEFGMIGIGKIYNFISACTVFRDDWLGHLFDPSTFEMSTLPFVELLFVIEKFVPEPINKLGNRIQDLFNVRFDSLTLEESLRIVNYLNLKQSSKIEAEINQLFSGKKISQKRADAIEMLDCCARHLDSVKAFNKLVN
jgi:TfuA protein